MSDGCYRSDNEVDEPETPAARIKRLERENAKLREALKAIAAHSPELHAAKIAREALA